MRIDEVFGGELITPKVTWKTMSDGSNVVRIEYREDKVFVHTNKNRSVLEKLVKERYGPKRFAE